MKVLIDKYHPICNDMDFANVYENYPDNPNFVIVIGDEVKFSEKDFIYIYSELDEWISIPLECVIKIED